MRRTRRCKDGFSLIEVVVAITVLGLVSGSIYASIIQSSRLNALARQAFQDELAVSNKVEELMASGITSPGTYRDDVTVTIEDDGVPGVYKVTVSRNELTVETYIHAADG